MGLRLKWGICALRALIWVKEPLDFEGTSEMNCFSVGIRPFRGELCCTASIVSRSERDDMRLRPKSGDREAGTVKGGTRWGNLNEWSKENATSRL